MKLLEATVLQNMEVMPNIHLLELYIPEISGKVQPGQFVMIKSGPGRVLPRPISVHGIGSNGSLYLLINNIGKGTEWLSQRMKDDMLQIIGPLGNGFSVSATSKNLLCIAGGMGIAPLVFLAHREAANRRVTMLIGAVNKSLLYPQDRLPKNISVELATDDGSVGRKGMVTDLISKYIGEADQIIACGPQPMYESIKNITDATGKTASIQISLEVRMGCGVGTCYGCSIKTQQGMKKVCKDGPVFNLSDVILHEVRI